MHILIIGSGGREHALAWKAAQSPLVDTVFVAPGNAGTAQENKVHNVDIAATEIQHLLDFAKQNHIDLTIVGPEAPLALGIVDLFNANQLPIFGPTQSAAKLESSKSFCKDFLIKHRIPTAAYATFTEIKPALEYVAQHSFPVVIKADGLAAGKGVVIAHDLPEATQAVQSMLEDQQFGNAGAKVVIEAFLQGEELSYIVMADGQHILPLASSQDHKRRDDGDLGPNTGGMGAYSPAPLCTSELEKTIMRDVIAPTIAAMQQDGTPYSGFLYAGLMVSPEGVPHVLEFNCRLGDPETQPLLMRLDADLIKLCLSATQGDLDKQSIQWQPQSALTVVMAAGGYPFHYEKNKPISGLENNRQEDVKVFHAGTRQQNDTVVTQGGRVLGVTALGENLIQARDKAYQAAEKIDWEGAFYRRDIGHRAVKDE